MQKQCFCWQTSLTAFLAVGAIIAPSSAICQILPDGTLGAERSQVTPNVMIRGELSDRIDGGALHGVNLFHSFSDFNVGNGQRVYFANPTGVNNILTRVTGANPSNIFGKLGVDGIANLFLINPNGILFGPNASLDIRGSFTASTASSFTFPNGEQFSATNPQAAPLLTVNVPVGLQNGTRSGQITNVGSLQVGQDLTLSASTINSTGQLFAPNGNLSIHSTQGDINVRHLNAKTANVSSAQNLNLIESQLGAVDDLSLQAQDAVRIRDSVAAPLSIQAGGNLLIQGNQSVDIFALNHPNSGLSSTKNMTFRSSTPIIGDAHYWSGGNFRVEQMNGGLGRLFSPHDPVIRAAGDVSFQSYSGASLHILAGGSVTIPIGIEITASDPVNGLVDSISLSNGTSLTINGKTQPTLDIRAGIETAFGVPGVVGTGFFFPTVPATSLPATGADITIGSIQITQPNGLVFLTNQYQPNNLPGNITVNGFMNVGGAINGFGTTLGDGGNVYIDSKGTALVRDLINTSGVGILFNPFIPSLSPVPPINYNGGNINIIANQDIAVSHIITSGLKSGGINLTSQSSVYSENSTINGTSLSPNSNITGESIQVNSNLVLLKNTSITTNAFFNSNGGSILVNASGSLIMEGVDGGLYAQTNGDGTAGNVTINAKNLIAQTGAVISTTTFSLGKAGDITISSSESVQVLGSQSPFIPVSFMSTQTASSGQAGNVRINTKNLLLQDGGVILAANSPAPLGSPNMTGAAGSIEIYASDSVRISGRNYFNTGSSLTAFTANNKPAGIIKITAGSLLVEDGASIATYPTDRATGAGGDLTIQANQLIIQGGSQVSAGTFGDGNGGDLEINVSDLIQVSGDGVGPAFLGGRSPSTLYTGSAGRTGKAGNLTINAKQLVIQDGAVITAETRGAGQAGDLRVVASENIEVIGSDLFGNPSKLTAVTYGTGSAGKASFLTKKLVVRDGALLTTETRGLGQAGDLTIQAFDLVEVAGNSSRGISSQITARTLGSGNAGNLNIETPRLSVLNGGQVTAYTTGVGRAGNLSVSATDLVQLAGNTSLGFPSVIAFDTFDAGDAGELRVITGRLLLQDGGRISAATSGSGRGGVIEVMAKDAVDVNGRSPDGQFASGLFFDSRGAGDARGIRINAGRLTVQNGGQVTVSGSGTGASGDLEINAGSIFVSDGGRLTATTSSGEGGNIRLQAKDSIVLRRDGDVRTQAYGTGNGGNIRLEAGNFILGILSEDSDVIASAVTGRGGNIFAKAAGIFGFRLFDRVETPESDFVASSEFGLDGTITLDDRNPIPSTPLPTQVVTPPLTQGCFANPRATQNQAPANRFFDSRRGGLPPNPAESLSRSVLWEDQRQPASGSTTSHTSIDSSTATQPTIIVEASSFKRDANGDILLVVDETTMPTPQFQAELNCYGQTLP